MTPVRVWTHPPDRDLDPVARGGPALADLSTKDRSRFASGRSFSFRDTQPAWPATSSRPMGRLRATISTGRAPGAPNQLCPVNNQLFAAAKPVNSDLRPLEAREPAAVGVADVGSY